MTFDPEKNRRNIAKHGISLARWVDMEMLAVVIDDRFDYGEERYRAFGRIGARAYCPTFTLREGDVRPISLRRCHAKEIALYETKEA